MKTLYLLSACCVILLASCSKDEIAQPAEKPVATAVAKPVTDSLSFEVEGKSYTYNRIASRIRGNTDAHRKVDSVVKGAYYISGHKDSVFYYRKFMFMDDKYDQVMLSFCKTYAKTDLDKVLGLFIPVKNFQDLFEPKKYNFISDFDRENNHNGIAISISNIGQSYSYDPLYRPDSFKPYVVGEADFEITSLKKIDDDKFILEARFNVPVYNSTLKQFKVSKGFVRINLSTNIIIF